MGPGAGHCGHGADALLLESVEQDGGKGGANQREVIASQMEKRPARFVTAR